MPLDIEIKGDPDGLRTTATWLKRTSNAADASAADIQTAQAKAQHGWDSPAAGGFQTVMGRFKHEIHDVSDDVGKTGKALDRHADTLDSCKKEMAKARKIAAEAGLRVTATQILEPGPPPAAPDPSQIQGPYTDPEARKAQARRAHAVDLAEYAAKVKAYYHAAAIVSACRKKEIEAQNHLIGFMANFNTGTPFNIANLYAGFFAGLLARHSRFAEVAGDWGRYASRVSKMIYPGISPSARAIAVSRRAYALAQEKTWQQHAVDNKLASHLANSKAAKTLFRPEGLSHYRGLKKVAGFTKGVPIAGWVITGGALAADVASGKDPAKSAVSQVGGTLAGAAAGSATAGSIGGPLGAAIGAGVGVVVGSGTGYAIYEWGDDVASSLGDRFSSMPGDIRDGFFSLAHPSTTQ